MKRNILIYLLIIFLGSIAVYIAIGSRDGGFLSRKPCGPPCFYGIVPDITTKPDLIKNLEDMGTYSSCDVELTTDKHFSTFRCSRNLFIVFSEDSDRVTNLEFQPNNRITIEKTLSSYGEPDAVWIIEEECCPEDIQHLMQLFYDDYNMILSLPIKSGYTYTVKPSDSVASIKYLSHENYNDTKNKIRNPNLRGALSSDLLRWVGYGEYDPSLVPTASP